MRLLTLLLALLVAISLAAAVIFDAQRVLDRPLDDVEENTHIVEVAKGLPYDQLVAEFALRGWLSEHEGLYLKAYGRISGLAERVRAGEYRVFPGDSLSTLLDRIVAGDVLLHELTLVEGWNFKQAFAALRKHPKIRAVLPEDPMEAMAALGMPGVHPEGQFLPETYRFAAGESDRNFLLRAHRAMRRVLELAWSERDQASPLKTAEELLILASIVERETGRADERGLIAGVFTRRLNIGMRLQTDPTVIYGMGDSFDGNIRRKDLRTDTPYNTYTRGGLPPTPICLPGAEAIRAAANPVASKALFFVARGDGSHKFSATLAEHNQAVREYQLRRGK